MSLYHRWSGSRKPVFSDLIPDHSERDSPHPLRHSASWTKILQRGGSATSSALPSESSYPFSWIPMRIPCRRLGRTWRPTAFSGRNPLILRNLGTLPPLKCWMEPSLFGCQTGQWMLWYGYGVLPPLPGCDSLERIHAETPCQYPHPLEYLAEGRVVSPKIPGGFRFHQQKRGFLTGSLGKKLRIRLRNAEIYRNPKWSTDNISSCTVFWMSFGNWPQPSAWSSGRPLILSYFIYMCRYKSRIHCLAKNIPAFSLQQVISLPSSARMLKRNRTLSRKKYSHFPISVTLNRWRNIWKTTFPSFSRQKVNPTSAILIPHIGEAKKSGRNPPSP